MRITFRSYRDNAVIPGIPNHAGTFSAAAYPASSSPEGWPHRGPGHIVLEGLRPQFGETRLAAREAHPPRPAKIAKVSRSTVVNVRAELAKETRKQARKGTRESANPPDRHQRAQRFLRDELARGPKRVTDVEEAAARAHVDPQTLEQARAPISASSPAAAMPGGVQAVQWSLPAS
jgi:hypothetical protein